MSDSRFKIVDRDGKVMSQGAFNHMMAEHDYYKGIAMDLQIYFSCRATTPLAPAKSGPQVEK